MNNPSTIALLQFLERRLPFALFWCGLGLLATVWLAGTPASAAAPAYPPAPITKDGTAVLLVDYATLPASGRGGSITDFSANVSYTDQLGRVNFLRSEPPDAPLASARFFVNDLSRNLSILTKSNRVFSTYINFQSVFTKFDNDPGFAGGLGHKIWQEVLP